MSDSSKNHDVEPGCLGIFLWFLMLIFLQGIQEKLGDIAKALEKLTPKVEETKR